MIQSLNCIFIILKLLIEVCKMVKMIKEYIPDKHFSEINIF